MAFSFKAVFIWSTGYVMVQWEREIAVGVAVIVQGRSCGQTWGGRERGVVGEVAHGT